MLETTNVFNISMCGLFVTHNWLYIITDVIPLYDACPV